MRLVSKQIEAQIKSIENEEKPKKKMVKSLAERIKECETQDPNMDPRKKLRMAYTKISYVDAVNKGQTDLAEILEAKINRSAEQNVFND